MPKDPFIREKFTREQTAARKLVWGDQNMRNLGIVALCAALGG
jgi:hypothetical protein